MEKNNNYKILTVVALFVAVLALAVGFAAYSATLTITDPSAVVTGDQFSPYVLYTGTPSCVASGNATVISEGTLNNKNWTGVSLRMEKPGDSVTCTASVQNGSLLTAYLESIKASKAIECVSYGTGEDDGNPATNFQSACDGMKLTFKAGTYDIATDDSATVGTTQATMESGPINGQTITAKKGDVISEQTVSFTLSYDANASVADGDFKINLPTMSLVYKTEE